MRVEPHHQSLVAVPRLKEARSGVRTEFGCDCAMLQAWASRADCQHSHSLIKQVLCHPFLDILMPALGFKPWDLRGGEGGGGGHTPWGKVHCCGER